MTCELRLDPHLACYFQQLLGSAGKEKRSDRKMGASLSNEDKKCGEESEEGR